ncbi:MAG: hypothetical protein MI921_15785, partial [Cytophagales bacterium]|nr:hypothetical protein [Cytophagales bacterium]
YRYVIIIYRLYFDNFSPSLKSTHWPVVLLASSATANLLKGFESPPNVVLFQVTVIMTFSTLLKVPEQQLKKNSVEKSGIWSNLVCTNRPWVFLQKSKKA